MMGRALAASEAERARIAASLHDGVVQDLIASSLQLSSQAQRAAETAMRSSANELNRAAAHGAFVGRRTPVALGRDLSAESGRRPGSQPRWAISRQRSAASPPRSHSTWTRPRSTRLSPAAAEADATRWCRRRSATRSNTPGRLRSVSGSTRTQTRWTSTSMTTGPASIRPRCCQMRDRTRGGHLGLRLIADAANRAGAELSVAAGAGTGDPLPNAGAGSMIKILVVDDHQLVRAGLSGLLDAVADLDVIGERRTARRPRGRPSAAARRRADGYFDAGPRRNRCDSSHRGRLSGPCDRRPHLVRRPRSSARDAAAGAVGYLLKDCEPDQLVAAVRAAAIGQVPLDPRVAMAVLPERGPAAREPEPSCAQQWAQQS